MYRSTTLDPSHYAGRWAIPSEDQRNDLAAVNSLGQAYALAADSPEKEAQLLVALEAFHGYLSKYLIMIVRGTIPPINSYAGRDALEFLRTLAVKKKKGEEPAAAESTCKMLHLAFKGMTTEDVYDTLVFCFVRAARRYDPHYADKTRQVCELIGENGVQTFTVESIEARVDYPCTNILRALVRKDFLSSVVGRKKVIGYELGPKWPAPASFFASGPIGFVYVMQIWFRYFLNEFVITQMANLESGGNGNDPGRDSSNMRVVLVN
jgi:hypothetical protein